MKKTILHFINDLGCGGGAEKMLVTVVKELTEYNNIIVTLENIKDYDSYEREVVCDKYICLNTPSAKLFPLAVLKLRRVINEYKPDIIHSHLFWPTLIARIATPKKIPLITTIHAFIATSIEYKKKHIKWLDKISYHLRKSIIIAVAKGVEKEYFSFLNLKPYRAYTLYTFVDTAILENIPQATTAGQDGIFRLISVGTLKEQKNYAYLLEAFRRMKDDRFELHVYGKDGHLQAHLQKTIDDNNITNVKLMGLVKNPQQLMQQYNLFVMSSIYEGFSLAVLEGMLLSMPMLLSDIDSFKEQCDTTAEYFDLNDVDGFIAKLKNLSLNKAKLQELGQMARQRVLANFTLNHHIKGLRIIYSETLNHQ